VTRRVIVRPGASRDLDEQADYITTDSNIETALRFYQAADETFELISRHPRIGRAIQLLSPLFVNARLFPLKDFDRFIVFYRPLRNGIEILRLVHGSRDIERLLES
jgi:toxin ParE1/3/4